MFVARLAFLYQPARQMLAGMKNFGPTQHVTFGEVIKGHNDERMPAEIERAIRRILQFHMNWTHV